MSQKRLRTIQKIVSPAIPAKVKTGFFCSRNNGIPSNPPKGGSIKYAAKHGRLGHEYKTNDRCYCQPPKLKEIQDRLLRT